MKDITQRLEDLGGKLISYSHPWSEWAQCVLVAKSEIESLRADNDRLREALKFYADRDTWRHGKFPDRPIDKDCDGDFRATPGLKARAALAKEPQS